jgi:uncharacterized RDD family membrane protein YckC
MRAEIGLKRSRVTDIYVRRNGQRAGPFSLEEINRHLAAGAVDPADEAWSEGSPGWKPLLSFRGVIVPGGASSTAMPVAIATPKDIVSLRYAGFWIRAVAFVIDAAILGVVMAVIVFVFGRVGGEMSILRAFLVESIGALYMPLMWSSPWRATLGQRVWRLRVTARDGDVVSVPRGALRVFGMILSAAIAGVGYVMVAFTADKRGLHDMIAGTRVLRVD